MRRASSRCSSWLVSSCRGFCTDSRVVRSYHQSAGRTTLGQRRNHHLITDKPNDIRQQRTRMTSGEHRPEKGKFVVTS